MLYWAFTTLTTIGLGDFNARSDEERILCSIIMLFGVSIVSYIMGKFIQILSLVKQMSEELDEGDMLSKFIQTLQRFNKDRPLN